MARFFVFLTSIEEAWATAPAGEGERVYAAYKALEDKMRKSGVYIDAIRLRSTNEAKSIRNRPDGVRDFSEGGLFAGKEQIGGAYVLQCASMNEALDWAKQMPNYGHGGIEIRPYWE